jgi:hypothetical protein
MVGLVDMVGMGGMVGMDGMDGLVGMGYILTPAFRLGLWDA